MRDAVTHDASRTTHDARPLDSGIARPASLVLSPLRPTSSVVPSFCQTTIRNPVRFSHRGLLTSRMTSIRLRPAPADSGIILNETIPALVANAFVEANRVGLRKGKEVIVGVEHLLAACYGLGIDNLRIEVIGGEVPFGDGSALPFTRLLRAAGRKRFRTARKTQSLLRPVVVYRHDSFVCALPDDAESSPDACPGINCFIRFPDPVVGEQFFAGRLGPASFHSELSPARTFGYRQEGQRLPQWLAGVTHITGDMVLPARPRFANEPVRHKTLDLVGDLALLGRRLRACIFAYKAGHKLHHDFLRELEDQWT